MLGHFYCLNLMLAILSDSVGESLALQNNDTQKLSGRKYAITEGDIITYIEKQNRVNTIDSNKNNFKNLIKSRCSLVHENMKQIFQNTRMNNILPQQRRSNTIQFGNISLDFQQNPFARHVKSHANAS